ncbi:adenosine-specific kinase [Candidatus Bathyarchaeota archaeon]|nr:adenosine-specific kinase [Candidatus Bathyarchaeota archaeon]
MKLKIVKVERPEGVNIILGQSHFIKTVEDIHESIVSSVPGAKFGLAFSESSGPCLVRKSGTDPELVDLAAENMMRISAGHTFLVMLKEIYPINVLNTLKDVQEVCSIYCATANPVEVIVAETGGGRGILGVVDGQPPRGVEGEGEAQERRTLLRKIGYKL